MIAFTKTNSMTEYSPWNRRPGSYRNMKATTNPGNECVNAVMAVRNQLASAMAAATTATSATGGVEPDLIAK